MKFDNWMVIESYDGVISLVVLNGTKVLFLRSGYEKFWNELISDINELDKGDRCCPIETWGYNEVGKTGFPLGDVICTLGSFKQGLSDSVSHRLFVAKR